MQLNDQQEKVKKIIVMRSFGVKSFIDVFALFWRNEHYNLNFLPKTCGFNKQMMQCKCRLNFWCTYYKSDVSLFKLLLQTFCLVFLVIHTFEFSTNDFYVFLLCHGHPRFQWFFFQNSLKFSYYESDVSVYYFGGFSKLCYRPFVSHQ